MTGRNRPFSFAIDGDRELVDLLEGDYSIIRVEGIFFFFFCKEELIIARV